MNRTGIFVMLMVAVFLMTGCSKKTMIPDINVSRMDAEQAIASAQSEIDEARKVGADVGEAESILKNARKLLMSGSYARAKSEAQRAQAMARDLKQQILAGMRSAEDAEAAIERARTMISRAKELGGDVSEADKMLAAARSKYVAADYPAAIEDADKAYALARAVLDALVADTYVVGTWEADRDCLWNIAKKKSIYNDPWKWKRIYIANREKIKNPDIIYPKQVLKIPQN